MKQLSEKIAARKPVLLATTILNWHRAYARAYGADPAEFHFWATLLESFHRALRPLFERARRCRKGHPAGSRRAPRVLEESLLDNKRRCH